MFKYNLSHFEYICTEDARKILKDAIIDGLTDLGAHKDIDQIGLDDFDIEDQRYLLMIYLLINPESYDPDDSVEDLIYDSIPEAREILKEKPEHLL